MIKRVAYVVGCLLAGWLLVDASLAPALAGTDSQGAADTVDIPEHVMHLHVRPGEGVVINGEMLSFDMATNRIAAATNLDAVALYVNATNVSALRERNELLEQLTRTTVNVFLVAGEEASTFTQKSSEPERRAFTLSTDQIRLLLGERDLSGKRAPSALQVELVDDEVANDLYLRRMQLGLPGRSVWLVHESDGEEVMSGVQIKKNW